MLAPSWIEETRCWSVVLAVPGWIIFNAIEKSAPAPPPTLPLCIIVGPNDEWCDEVAPYPKKSIGVKGDVDPLGPQTDTDDPLLPLMVGNSMVVVDVLGDEAGEESAELQAGTTRDS